MLTIKIRDQEFFDNERQQFVVVKATVLDLEHSLVSVSKWESIHEVPFLSDSTKLTDKQLTDYLKCMVVTPDVDPNVLFYADGEDMKRIQDYIASSSSATTFRQLPESNGRGEQITSELVYYWMNACGIPQDAENWHLNRLFSLIRIHSVKNEKPKERTTQEIAAERREENERRRKEFNSTG